MTFPDMSQSFGTDDAGPVAVAPGGRPPPITTTTVGPQNVYIPPSANQGMAPAPAEKKFPWLILVSLAALAAGGMWYMHSQNMKKNGSDDDSDDDDEEFDDEGDSDFDDFAGFDNMDEEFARHDDDDEDGDYEKNAVKVGKKGRPASVVDDPFFARGALR